MIEVKNLTKLYGDSIAVDDVDFRVASGEVLGFLGPNGAGKTTTMRMITGYLPPSSGTVEVDGYDVLKQPLEVRRRIGYLPETVPLYPEMSVRDYLTFMATIRDVPGKRINGRLADVMAMVHLDDVADKLIRKLSRGYRQRVGLAQALIHDPPVLVLDEPTVGLDPRQIADVRALIKSLGGDRSIILSTHILPEVSMTCSRVVIINRGAVVAEDTPEGLVQRLAGAERVHVEVAGPVAAVTEALQSLPFVTQVEAMAGSMKDGAAYLVAAERDHDIRTEIARTVVGNNWGLLELRPLGMSLEDVFLKVITSEVDATPADAVDEPEPEVEEVAAR